MKKYDVIVVGTGGGTKLVRPVADMGLKVAVIEKDRPGGTCLNRGCIPSKMLIHPADVATVMREADRFNIKGVDPVVDFAALVERVDKTIDHESASIPFVYEKHPNIDYIPHEARFVKDRVLEVNGEQITADRIFLGVGARPDIPDIEGLKGTPFMTSNEALREKKQPKKLLVLGAGYIACELGYFYGALGTEVHFIVRSTLLRKQDKDIREAFTQSFKKRFSVHEGLVPDKVEYEDGIFKVICGKTVLEGDALLVVTGVKPWTDCLGIENTSINLDENGYIVVDDYLRTSCKGVWALGDCIGRYLFRHAVNFEGEYLFSTLFKDKVDEPICYPPMPSAVFSHPQIGSVGHTEDACIEKGIDYFVGMNKYADSAMGMALCSDEGFVKLIFEKGSQKLIGAHILGEEASNMIHMLIYAMTFGARLSDLLKMIYIHPALPEVVRNAARKAAATLV
ncbi:MAG: dihydrolipoyl dehydrogenase [Chlamydiales bacterium]|nr:dihydrolipoyl dehydrogenase [Chlamydiales bacterium]